MTAGLPAASAAPLAEKYVAMLLDLDGVLQLGDEPVPNAPDAVASLRGNGVRLAFVTNNASRTPEQVAATLQHLGVECAAGEVVTSSMAAASLLAERLPSGSRVLVVGGEGLEAAVAAAGLQPVTTAAEIPAAVVQGYGPDVCWRDLAEASVALRAGAAWVATNLDRTLPSPRGPLPGNGSLVAALRTATGLAPEAVGKPGPALFRAAVRNLACDDALVVGDRLDTDIAGASAAGLPSLLVLSGVSSAADVLRADDRSRPTFLGRDVGAALEAHPDVNDDADGARCRGVRIGADGSVRRVDGDGDWQLDGLRAAARLAWTGRLQTVAYDACLRALGF